MGLTPRHLRHKMAASSQDIVKYISDDTGARMVTAVITILTLIRGRGRMGAAQLAAGCAPIQSGSVSLQRASA
jgi:hypothetical protein